MRGPAGPCRLKNWECIKKGIPLRVEIGPRDLENGNVMVARRDKAHKDKHKMSFEELNEKVPQLLEEIQKNYCFLLKDVLPVYILTEQYQRVN